MSRAWLATIAVCLLAGLLTPSSCVEAVRASAASVNDAVQVHAAERAQEQRAAAAEWDTLWWRNEDQASLIRHNPTGLCYVRSELIGRGGGFIITGAPCPDGGAQ